MHPLINYIHRITLDKHMQLKEELLTFLIILNTS